jgi:hypothetical protein
MKHVSKQRQYKLPPLKSCALLWLVWHNEQLTALQ